MPVIWGGIVAGLAYIGGGSAVAGAITVGVTAGTLVYQRSQQKKAQRAAQAQAARLKKEQARAMAEQQRALREMSKLTDFGSPEFAQQLTVMIKRSVVPRRFVYGRARVGGIWLYVETTGPSNDFVHLVLGLCEGPIEAIESIHFDDEVVTLDASGNGTGKWAGNLLVKKYLGTADQTADPTLVAASAAKWTTAHKLKGIAYLYLRFARNPEVFPTLPEVSAVIRGKNDIRDPRTGVTGYSDNAALCLADYMGIPLRGPGFPVGEINADALTHAANVCDQPVELLAGGTEKRYTISGAIDLQNTVEDNIASFLQSMAGDMIFSNGEWEIQAGEYRTPTFELTADMLTEGFTVSHLQPRKDRVNVVKGTFVAEANRWQRFDFPAVSRTAYVDEDGQESVRDLNLELVGSGSQAQRLASIELEQSRCARTLNMTCNFDAMPAKPGGSVLVTLARHFDHHPMRVLETTTNLKELTIQMTLIETAPDIYAWSRTREKQVNVPPEVNAKNLRAATPTFSPEAGEHPIESFPLSVSISTLTPGASIRYSLSAVPSTSSDGTAYSAPLTINDGDILYARAFKAGYEASSPAIGAFVNATDLPVATPTFSPAAGEHPIASFPLSVAISTLTPGASIRYSYTDVPATSSSGISYEGAVPVSDGQTLYARAFKAGYEASSPAIGTFVGV